MTQIQVLIHQMLGPMLDALPHPTFLVDEDVTIISLNKASRELIGKKAEFIIRRRAGEILHCIHSEETEEGCGRSFFCSDCIIRNSVNKAFREQISTREKIKMEIVSKKGIVNAYLLIIISPFEHDEKQYALLQIENITEIMEFRKLIPICSICKKIRNDSEYWHNIESYFNKYLDIDFSHGICPKCTEKYYPDITI